MRGIPLTQIHLDYHTSADVPRIADRFEAGAFANRFREANTESVTVFARCCHGYSYYPTQVGTVHPGLNFDLFGAQIDALHEVGIRAPIYLTVAWDNLLWQTHPHWRALLADGSPVPPHPRKPGWEWLSLAEPGLLSLLLAQVDELLDRYRVDGFFFDIVMTPPGGDFHPAAVAFRAQHGYDDAERGDDAIARALMRQVSLHVRGRQPEATIWFNSRFGTRFALESEDVTHVEIEALPTGQWGYNYFPFWSRYAESFRLPTLGMTGRFHESWGDFGGLKTAAALHFEAGGMLASGAAMSIGDQLLPDGALEGRVYETIGEVFDRFRPLAREVVGSEPVTEVLVVTDRDDQVAAQGALRIFLDQGFQVRVVTPGQAWPNFALVVLPEGLAEDRVLRNQAESHLAEGGSLLLAGSTLVGLPADPGTYTEDRASDPTYYGLEGYRFVVHGPCPTFALDSEKALSTWPSFDALFNRTEAHYLSHVHAPPETEPHASPVAYVAGKLARIVAPVLTDFAAKNASAHRRFVREVTTTLGWRPRLRSNAPASTEKVLRKDPNAERWFLILVAYAPDRRSAPFEVISEEATLSGVWVEIDGLPADLTAKLLPSHLEIPIQVEGPTLRLEIPEFRIYTVIELKR